MTPGLTMTAVQGFQDGHFYGSSSETTINKFQIGYRSVG